MLKSRSSNPKQRAGTNKVKVKLNKVLSRMTEGYMTLWNKRLVVVVFSLILLPGRKHNQRSWDVSAVMTSGERNASWQSKSKKDETRCSTLWLWPYRQSDERAEREEIQRKARKKERKKKKERKPLSKLSLDFSVWMFRASEVSLSEKTTL